MHFCYPFKNLRGFFLLSLFLAAFSMSSQALSSPLRTDTTGPVEVDRSIKDKDLLLEKYGRDDTARAIILYYSSGRKSAKTATLIGGILLAAGTAVIGFGSATAQGLAFLGPALLGGLGIVAGGILLLVGLLSAGDQRQSLYKMLERYLNGGGLHKGLRKDRKFLSWMGK